MTNDSSALVKCLDNQLIRRVISVLPLSHENKAFYSRNANEISTLLLQVTSYNLVLQGFIARQVSGSDIPLRDRNPSFTPLIKSILSSTES